MTHMTTKQVIGWAFDVVWGRTPIGLIATDNFRVFAAAEPRSKTTDPLLGSAHRVKGQLFLDGLDNLEGQVATVGGEWIASVRDGLGDGDRAIFDSEDEAVEWIVRKRCAGVAPVTWSRIRDIIDGGEADPELMDLACSAEKAERARADADELRRGRDRFILRMLDKGVTAYQVAKWTGLSQPMIAKIRDRDREEG